MAKVELDIVKVWVAYDNREWGAGWGMYTTKEEAEEAVKQNQTKYTVGTVEEISINVLKEIS